MQPYNSAIQALGAGDLALDDGTFDMAYLLDAYAEDLTDVGHDFEADLGANISHRQALVNPTWVDRVFDADDMSVVDPDNGDTVTKIAIIKTSGTGGGGAAATNRVVAYQALASAVTWDGTNDNHTFDAQGIFRIGAA